MCYYLNVHFQGQRVNVVKHYRIQEKNIGVFIHIKWIFLFTMTQQPLVGHGLLIFEDSRSHSDTPYTVGLIWKSDQPVAETSTCTTHNTHNRQTSMPSAGFEPAIPTSERPQTQTLDRAATGICTLHPKIYNL